MPQQAYFASRALRALVTCAFATIIAFGLTGCPAGPATYTGCQGNTHCYGIVQYDHPVFGTYQVTMVPQQLAGGDGHISDEMWVLDTSTKCSPNNPCWIEVGEVAGADQSGCNFPANETHFFWADQRPGSKFFCHDFGKVQNLSGFGFNIPVNVAVLSLQDGNFSVVIYDGPSTNLNGGSTHNSMQMNEGEAGLEVEGTNSASAPLNPFSSMFYAPLGSGFYNVVYENNTGSVTLNSPPVNASWIGGIPSSQNQGAAWVTTCCTSN